MQEENENWQHSTKQVSRYEILNNKFIAEKSVKMAAP